MAPFRLFSPPSSQTPYSQNCPFASRPPVPAPSMQLCLRSLGALRCAYCRGRPMCRPSTLKKKKKKKSNQVLSFCGQRKGAPRVFVPFPPQPSLNSLNLGLGKRRRGFSWCLMMPLALMGREVLSHTCLSPPFPSQRTLRAAPPALLCLCKSLLSAWRLGRRSLPRACLQIAPPPLGSWGCGWKVFNLCVCMLPYWVGM